MVMIKSMLRRSIRRAQKHDLIGKNVADLVDLPTGRPGRPSRAMTQEQAGKVLRVASAQTPRLGPTPPPPHALRTTPADNRIHQRHLNQHTRHPS
jgi:hypothetical protein